MIKSNKKKQKKDNMRVITLLRELNISLERLQSYETSLDKDFKFKVVNQFVPDDIYQQIIGIHKNQPISQPKKKEILVFTSDDNYRFNAKIKWYYNKQTDGEYGFIEKSGLPDIYFSGEHFLYSDPKNLKPNDEVVVTIAKQDIDDRKDEIKAISVNSLWEEKDLQFLLFHFFTNLEQWSNNLLEIILKQISEVSEQINDDILKAVETYVFEKIDYTKLQSSHYKSLGELLKIFGIDVNAAFLKYSLNSDTVFKYWNNCTELIIDFTLIKTYLLNHLKDSFSNIHIYISRIENSAKKDFLDAILMQTCSGDVEIDFTKIVSLLSLYGDNGISPDLDKLPETLQLKLWENQKIDSMPFDAIFNKLMHFKTEYYENELNRKEQPHLYRKYFDKIGSDDLKNLLGRLHFDKDSINDKKTFETVTFFIKHIPAYEFLENFIETIYIKSTPYFKLLLFIEDYTDSIDYHDLVIYTGLLSNKNQKLFFKKILKHIDECKLVLTLDDLNLITTIDYQTSEYAKEIDGVGLDFTLSVILKLITDLKNNSITRQSTIFDLVANQIKRPTDFLIIDGFFEKCTGKTVIEENKYVSKSEDDKKIYNLVKKEHFLPRFSSFCDGRKAVNKVTTEADLCTKSGFEFWWCENSQCYAACRTLHTSSDWRNYTLEDVLTILEIPYNVNQYEILLNVINRVNRFLTHLTCRSCKTILKPKGKSNYSFYGVTLFSCANQECEHHSKDIYLSHCLNGQCEDIIDSRDSVKCKTHDVKEECGWYICKNCNACCSSEKLVARKSNLERLGQEYKCHTTGHLDRGIICCSGCGNEMIDATISKDLYQKQLDWLIANKNNHRNILRAGQRPKDQKWWFIWGRGTMDYQTYRNQLQSFFKSGFNIPDFNDKEKDTQLVAEPFEEKKVSKERIFVCPNCDLYFDLNNKEDFDFQRKRAVKKFHVKIFPQTDK
jgi:hypothetical protein